MADVHPIASRDVLIRNGMDLKKFGCCAKRVKEGKETIELGCEHWRTCPDAAKPMEDAIEGDDIVEGGQRPRNWKYLLIKPTVDGKRKVKEGFCACYEFFENFGKLHGKNGVVCKVTGGEGASYQARGSKKVTSSEPGQEPTWEPRFWTAKVPAFRPPDQDQLVTEAYANKVLEQLDKEDDDEAIRSALSGGNDEQNVTLNIEMDEVAGIIGKRTP